MSLANRSAPRERGFAMIAILSLAALVSAFLIASALNPTEAGVSNEREQRTMNALTQAKAALISYAANEGWQKFKDPATANQPGGLPCPDGDDDGDSDGICPNAQLRIGRLPYKTIGSPDLTDASGERLWYAVSSNFYKSAANVINSDTPGLLTVAGTTPATNVVAVVIAPGDALAGQDRNLQHNSYLAYLEGVALDSPAAGDSTFNTVGLPTAAANDRLVTLTQAELMAAVEPVVAARIERDIRAYITQNYIPNDFNSLRSWWAGGYPFAVAWGGGPGQPQDNYKGDAITPTAQGLMPITRETNFVMWDTSSISVTQLAGGTGGYAMGTLTIGPVNCSASTGSQISCRIDYPGDSDDRPQIRIDATLLNAGRAFVRAMVSGNETVRDTYGAVRGWSNTTSPNPYTVRSTLQANGNGTIRYEGRLINAWSMGNRATITIPVSYHPVSDTVDMQAGWFIANQWYRQTYYAVSQGWIPGGGTSCTAGVTCLTVNNLPTAYAPSNNKRLILVFAGRAFDGSTRPTNNLANYLEGQNATPGDLIFEHRSGFPGAVNDRVVVVSP